jgi:hypothetical protein
MSGGTKLFTQRTIANSGTIRWTGGDIWSGSSATINNQNGSLFDIQGDTGWLFNQGGNPPILINGGTIQRSIGAGVTSLNVVLTNTGVINLLSGTFALSGQSFANQSNGVVQGSATLDISSTTVVSDGQFSPGSPLGALQVIGNVPNSTMAQVNIELGGTVPGVSFDQLRVTGAATLRGALNISVVNGFQPAVGTSFEILNYASHSGTFDNIFGLNVGSGFYLEPTINATNVVLTMIDTRPRPVFLPPQRLPDGTLRIVLSDVAGQSITVQATTNFFFWEPVLTNAAAGAEIDLIIDDIPNHPYRFFRAVQ